jgi:hypothetical protein
MAEATREPRVEGPSDGGKPVGRTREEQIRLNQEAIAWIDDLLASEPTEDDLAEAARWDEFLKALDAHHSSERHLFAPDRFAPEV